jgi:hypothetical protein
MVSVSVPKELATAGSGFSFPLPASMTNASSATAATAIKVTTSNGGELPAWLKFNAETKSFAVSAAPEGSFPLRVIVTINGESTTVVISERAE